ncbi:MAG: HAD hydrolase-like protein [Clostridia bacterium]|nr:HAD hydrolase-like protein [Clostridia bacterium]
MKRYSVLLFDLDGTLTDPESGLIKSFVYALDHMGVDYGDPSSLKRYIGPALYTEWKRDYGFNEEEVTRALAYFREYFAPYGWCDNRMFDGIPEMLDACRADGRKIALATAKPEVFARKILDMFRLTEKFDFIAGAVDEKIRDKKWEVIDYVLTQFPDVPRSEFLMVGDRVYDAEGAEKCGIDSLGVLWGQGSAQEIAEAPFLSSVDSVSDLPAAVRALEEK